MTTSASSPLIAGQLIGQSTDNHDGTYTATIRSSTAIGQATITATDTSPVVHVSGQATLTQFAAASSTSLLAVPASPSTNESVTLLATVSAALPQSGTVAFENGVVLIAGCTAVAITPANPTAACHTSFHASSTPAQLTAVFTPDASSQVSGSAGVLSVAVGRDSTVTSLDVSNPTITVGSSATYTATVTPSHPGPVSPTGSIAFLDGGQPIAACAARPASATAGSATATCTVPYAQPGTHTIVAQYSGDANFSASALSLPQAVSVRTRAPTVLGTITATMQWSFRYAPAYTKVLLFAINRAPIGSTVIVKCRGTGCPFARSATVITKAKRCVRKGKRRCVPLAPGSVSLTARFANRKLRPGTTITVTVVRPAWIGKYYQFTVRARRAPGIQIMCLAPGGTRPGVGC